MDRWLYRIVRECRKVVPEEAVARTARATSLVERDREIESVPFFWSFLFGTTQPDGSVTKVQEFYKIFTNHDAAYSSIQQWITTDLKSLLSDVFAHLSIELGATEPALGGRFDRFRDVFIADATDCTLSIGGSYAEFCNRLVPAVLWLEICTYVGRYGMDGSAGVRTNFVGASGQTAV